MAQITNECGLAIESPLYALRPPPLMFPEETEDAREVQRVFECVGTGNGYVINSGYL